MNFTLQMKVILYALPPRAPCVPEWVNFGYKCSLFINLTTFYREGH